MQMKDIKVRVSEEAKSWLIERAKTNNRTLNGEINQILKAERERSQNTKEVGNVDKS